MMDESRKPERRRRADQAEKTPPTPPLPENPCQQKIARWLKTMKLRPVMLGGVSEKQVWKRIGELNAMYQEMLAIERARYEMLLHQAGITFDPQTPYPPLAEDAAPPEEGGGAT